MRPNNVEVRTSQFVASGVTGVVLETSSLGSCVAVALYDAEARIAGLCHALLDRRSRFDPDLDPGRCADTAVVALVEAMLELGAARDRLTAHLAGGGNMFGEITDPVYDVGSWNVQAARDALGGLGIPILGEHVGGGTARRLRIEVQTGTVTVRTHGYNEVL